jgi:flagellar biosynthesis component FlhA
MKEVRTVELTLAILMVLGIFVGIPAIIGFTITGGYLLVDRRSQKTKRTKAVEEETKKEHTPVA